MHNRRRIGRRRASIGLSSRLGRLLVWLHDVVVLSLHLPLLLRAVDHWYVNVNRQACCFGAEVLKVP